MKKKSRLQEFKEKCAAKQKKDLEIWEQERVLLEQRTMEYQKVDLGDGLSLHILKRLPESLEEEFMGFADRWEKAQTEEREGKLTEQRKEALFDEFYEWLAVLCQNPLFTKDYFKENKDKISTEDILVVVLGYYAQSQERVVKRIQELEKRIQIRKFREK